MTKLRRKGFTLIELIAVLVIMAILALIVTPLVMNIIRKARIAADKRSIDAYGRSIELAIAGYLLDNGKFPTSVGDLSIEYSGDEVICSITQLNDDSSVYLTGCTVKGRTVDYAYGEDKNTAQEPVVPTYTAYTVGEHISYNGVTYYVIEDSDTTNDTVKLLKETPLLKTEIEGYNISGLSVGGSTYGTVEYGSSTDYTTSTVKQVVDKWEESAVESGDNATARLISLEDLTNNLGYESEVQCITGTCKHQSTNSTPSWVTQNTYWTMTQVQDSSEMWVVVSNSGIQQYFLSGNGFTEVRPVLDISKTADLTKLES